MEISKFNGIVQYHDGLAVSDYCNMVPLDDSVIDRQGETLATAEPWQYSSLSDDHTELNAAITAGYNDLMTSENSQRRVINTFTDSHENIYVATNRGIWRYRVDEPAKWTPIYIASISTDVKFCESGTKPSIVYICFEGRVYYITDSDELPTLFIYPLATGPGDDALVFDDNGKPVLGSRQISSDSDELGIYNIPTSDWDIVRSYFNVDDWPYITSITWFDNRLVLVQADKNTVWLSEVDPLRYLNGDQPLFISDTAGAYLNSFMPYYYSSTASAARLRDAIAFGGQLYFLNSTTIEVWSATGNASNPIQHNTQNVINYGGYSPVIINDILYIIAKDGLHNDFLAGIDRNGSLQHLSNNEIERRMQNSPESFIRPLTVRDQSMVVWYRDSDMLDGYSITITGKWWRYYNGEHRRYEFMVWSCMRYKTSTFGITNQGRLATIADNHRTYVNGARILRYIRGGFMQFVTRKILRSIEVLCDTGVHYDLSAERPKAYARVSFDRGLCFGPYNYRVFGSAGDNTRRLIWRNLGSGNSVLFEFGTADSLRFQIYGIDFDLV